MSTTVTERTPLLFDYDPIEKEGAALQKYIEELHEKRAHVDAAIACLRKHYVDGQADSVSIRSGYRAQVLLMVHVTDFRQVLPVLQALRDSGYHAKKTIDWLEMHCRIYDYGDIEIRAWLPGDDSGACKRVKVGEKMEPVYKYVCPDGETI